MIAALSAMPRSFDPWDKALLSWLSSLFVAARSFPSAC